jgi:hypothetical protein
MSAPCTKTFEVRCSDAEYSNLSRLADSSGLSLSEMARMEMHWPPESEAWGWPAHLRRADSIEPVLTR